MAAHSARRGNSRNGTGGAAPGQSPTSHAMIRWPVVAVVDQWPSRRLRHWTHDFQRAPRFYRLDHPQPLLQRVTCKEILQHWDRSVPLLQQMADRLSDGIDAQSATLLTP